MTLYLEIRVVKNRVSKKACRRTTLIRHYGAINRLKHAVVTVTQRGHKKIHQE